MKRVKVIRHRPNLLFETWLEEWKNEAAAKNSDLQYYFLKALKSLRKYPLPLASGQDCIILQNFGAKLCSMLDKKLEEYNNNKHCTPVVSLGSRKENVTYEHNLAIKYTDHTNAIKNSVVTEPSNAVKEIGNGSYGKDDLMPNKFDIILLVDTQEVDGKSKKLGNNIISHELTQLGVPFEIRHLKVGDFMWIARDNLTSEELVLPYIVERKRIDDLSASIVDGRFQEQKFRLKRSGIENVTYVIERYSKNYRTAIPFTSLMQAAVNSFVHDGFIIQHTRDHHDTMCYLARFTKILNDKYKEKRLIPCKKEDLTPVNILSTSVPLMRFKEFNKTASKLKNFKVNEMFVRQLLQLKGISIDKALAIVQEYPTPLTLIETLQKADVTGEQVLATIKCGQKKRQLGSALSKSIHQLYTKKQLT